MSVAAPDTVVIADTGPPHYLVLVGAADLLPTLFGSVIVPEAVLAELRRPRTPAPVRHWVASPPPWFTSRSTAPKTDLPHPDLGDGERAAIALARGVEGPVLLLMDDRAATAAARAEGFRVIGTVGVLLEGAARGLVDLGAAFGALRETNFHFPPALFDRLLEAHGRRAPRDEEEA